MTLLEFACIFFVLVVSALSFYAGKTTADNYHRREELSRKEALEKQYLRLISRMDADDPCKPYYYSQPVKPSGMSDELLAQFENKMRTDGQATALLKNKIN